MKRCPQLVHFMFTRATGPACVNGCVRSDPQTGQGGRGGVCRESPVRASERSVIGADADTPGGGWEARSEAREPRAAAETRERTNLNRSSSS